MKINVIARLALSLGRSETVAGSLASGRHRGFTRLSVQLRFENTSFLVGREDDPGLVCGQRGFGAGDII